jgi:hypothetical protein
MAKLNKPIKASAAEHWLKTGGTDMTITNSGKRFS